MPLQPERPVMIQFQFTIIKLFQLAVLAMIRFLRTQIPKRLVFQQMQVMTIQQFKATTVAFTPEMEMTEYLWLLEIMFQRFQIKFTAVMVATQLQSQSQCIIRCRANRELILSPYKKIPLGIQQLAERLRIPFYLLIRIIPVLCLA